MLPILVVVRSDCDGGGEASRYGSVWRSDPVLND
jgi:hypothetical protein